MKLSDRQERILRVVVEEYIATARPVPSALVAQRSGLNVSAATVRNELASLEDLGFVLQLHTSGGRIPTPRGYRYYIEQLMPTATLANEEQATIRFQLGQTQREIDEWLKLAAAVVAHRAHNVAVVTPPRSVDTRVKHVEFVLVQPSVVLVITVTTDGSVVQEMASLDEPRSQEELSATADRLNPILRGLSSREIEAHLDTVPPHMQSLTRVVAHCMQRAVERQRQIYHEGLTEMLRQPEFSDGRHPEMSTGERLSRVIEFLQQGMAMEDLLALMALERGVQVVIGGEEPLVVLPGYSIVLGRYGTEGPGGVLGVLGPTRMEYGRAVSLVRYMTDLMTDYLLRYS